MRANRTSGSSSLPRARCALATLVACATLLLGGCDSDQLATLPMEAPLSDAPATGTDFATDSVGSVSADTRVAFSTVALVSLNAASNLAHWRMQWQLRDDVASTVAAGAELRITPYAALSGTPDAQLPIGATTTVALDAMSANGELVLALPVDISRIVLAVALDAEADSQTPVWTERSAPLELPVSQLLAAAEPLAALHPHLVPGSYATRIDNGRRVHQFAVRVLDQNCQSVASLQQQAPATNGPGDLTVLENDRIDSESSLHVTRGRNDITLYLVIDVSSSIGDDAPHVVEAARSIKQEFESHDYRVDLRQFSGTVTRVSSLEALHFETGVSSTAMYYAIDTVLDDIAQRADNSDHNAILVLTDGQDLASRNYYRGAVNTGAVHQYLQQRIAAIRSSGLASLEPNPFGVGLELHTVSVDRDGNQPVDHQRLEALAWEGGGLYTPLANFDEIKSAFEGISKDILYTYNLVYSSQQLPDDSALSLHIRTQGLEDIMPVRHHGGEPATTSASCRASSG